MRKLLTILLLATCLTSWAAVDEEFDYGDCRFKVIIESQSYQTGSIRCMGLSAQGKSKSSLDLTIPYYVYYHDFVYNNKSIDWHAFQGCNTLKSVRFEHGILDTGHYAFAECENLTTVYLPSSVYLIGSHCFHDTHNLKTVYYAGSEILVFPEDSFDKGLNLTLYVPRGSDINAIRNMRPFSVEYFPTIKTSSDVCDYSLKDGSQCVVTYYSNGDEEVRECKIVGFNNKASGVTNGKFVPNDYIDKTICPDGIKCTAIGDSAFYENSDLKELDLSQAPHIKTVGKCAILGCPNLTKVDLGSIEEIKWYGLSVCDALTTLTIPASVTKIETATFALDCPALTKIDVSPSNTVYSSYSNQLYNKNMTILYRVPAGYSADILTFPSTLKKISNAAVLKVKNIKEVDIHHGVESLGTYAFQACQQLNKVYIPSSVKEIGSSCFYYCRALTDFYINMPTPPSINKKGMFGDVAPRLYVPIGKEQDYKNAGWTGFETINSYNHNKIGACDCKRGTLSYTITSTKPATINDIDYDGLAMVVRSEEYEKVAGVTNVPAHINIFSKKYAVTRINEYGFGTKNSYSITGCANVDTVEAFAFKDTPITNIELPKARYFSPYVFENCNSLTTVELGNNPYVSSFVFSNLTALTEVVARNGIRFETAFFQNNAPNFTLYVPNTDLATAINSVLKDTQFNSTSTCADHVSPLLYPRVETTYPLGVIVPLSFEGCDFKAYSIDSPPDPVTHVFATTCRIQSQAGRGLILTDLEPNRVYKLKRISLSGTASSPYLVAATSSTNIMPYGSEYYWNSSENKFTNDFPKRRTINAGMCYLRVPDGATEYYIDLFAPASTGATGDVNGDGNIDIADVNVVINVMLGKASAASYPGADVNKDGTVDIADVNKILNTMLGK